MKSSLLFYLLYCFGFCLSLFFTFLNWDSSPFLGDQIDQFQNASFLFKGRLKSFYGPYLSTTYPIVYPIGPFSYIILASLKHVVSHPYWIHTGFALFNIIALIYTTHRLRIFSHSIAFLYFFLTLTSFVYWFSISILWSNVLLYFLSSLLLISFLNFLRRRTLENYLSMILFFILSLHLHLISIMFLPLILYAITLIQIKIFHKLRFQILSLLILLSVIPYIYVEVIRKFANTKAILFNVSERNPEGGFRTIEIISSLYLFPFTDSFYKWSNNKLILIGFLLLSIIIFFLVKKIPKKKFQFPMLTSHLIILISVIIFFLKVGQTYRSLHYFLLFLPFSILFVSYVVLQFFKIFKTYFPISRTSIQSTVIFGFSILVVINFKSSIVPTNSWNFENTLTSLRSICDKYPIVDTFEWNEFRSPESKFDTVLKYIIHEYKTECTFQESASILLYPSIEFHFLEFFEHPITKRNYTLLEVHDPGIGIYKIKN